MTLETSQLVEPSTPAVRGMVGYAKSRRVGATLYNAAHSYRAPAALRYGLNYESDFKDTHLGRIGH